MIVEVNDLKKTAAAIKKIIAGGHDDDGKGRIEGWFWMTRVPKAVDSEQEPILLVTLQGKDKSGAKLKVESKKIRQKIGRTKFTQGYLTYTTEGILEFHGDKNITGFKKMLAILSVGMKFGKLKTGRLILGDDAELADNSEEVQTKEEAEAFERALKEKYADVIEQLDDNSGEIEPMTEEDVSAYLAEEGVSEALIDLEGQLANFLGDENNISVDRDLEERLGGKVSIKAKFSKMFSSDKSTYGQVLDGLDALDGNLSDAQRSAKIMEIAALSQSWLSKHPNDRHSIRGLSLSMLKKELFQEQESLLLKEHATADANRKLAIKAEMSSLRYNMNTCEASLALGINGGLEAITNLVISARDHKSKITKHLGKPDKQQKHFEALQQDVEDGLYLITQFREAPISDDNAALLSQYENELNQHEFEAVQQMPNSIASSRLSSYLLRNGRQILEANKKIIREKQRIVEDKSSGNSVEKEEAVTAANEILELERSLHSTETMLISMMSRQKHPLQRLQDSINTDLNVLVHDINETVFQVSKSAISNLQVAMSAPKETRIKAREEMLEFIDNMFDSLNPGNLLVGGVLRPVTNSGDPYADRAKSMEAAELRRDVLDQTVLGKLETRVDFINRELESLEERKNSTPPPDDLEEVNKRIEAYQSLLDACKFAVMPANAFDDDPTGRINATRAWNKSMQTRLNKLRRRQKLATGEAKDALREQIDGLERMVHKLQKNKRDEMRNLLVNQREVASKTVTTGQEKLRELTQESDVLFADVQGKRERLVDQLKILPEGHPLKKKSERYYALDQSVNDSIDEATAATERLESLLAEIGTKNPSLKSIISLPEKTEPMSEAEKATFLKNTRKALESIHDHMTIGGEYSMQVSVAVEDLFDKINNLAIVRSERDASWNTLTLLTSGEINVEAVKSSMVEQYKRATKIDEEGFLFPKQGDRIERLKETLTGLKNLPVDNQFRIGAIEEIEGLLAELLVQENGYTTPIWQEYNNKIVELKAQRTAVRALDPDNDTEEIAEKNNEIQNTINDIKALVGASALVLKSLNGIAVKVAKLEAQYLNQNPPVLSSEIQAAVSALRDKELEQIEKRLEVSQKQGEIDIAVAKIANATTDLIRHQQTNQLQEALTEHPNLKDDLAVLKGFDQDLMGMTVFGNWNILVWEGRDAGHYTFGEEISEKLIKKNKELQISEMLVELEKYLIIAKSEVPGIKTEQDTTLARIKEGLGAEARTALNAAELEQANIKSIIDNLDKDAADYKAQISALSKRWNAEEDTIKEQMNTNAHGRALVIELMQKRGALTTVKNIVDKTSSLLEEAKNKSDQWALGKKAAIAEMLMQAQVQSLAKASNRVMSAMSGIMTGNQTGIGNPESRSNQEVIGQRTRFVEAATESLTNELATKVALRDDPATSAGAKNTLISEIADLEGRITSETESLISQFDSQIDSDNGSLTSHPDELIYAWSQVPELFQPAQIRAQSEAYHKYQDAFGEDDERLRYEGKPSRAENLRQIAKSFGRVTGDELLQGKWSELVDNYATDIASEEASQDRSKDIYLERLQAFEEATDIPLSIADLVIDIPDVLGSGWEDLGAHDFSAGTVSLEGPNPDDHILGNWGPGFGMSETGSVDGIDEQAAGMVSGAIGVLSIYTIYKEKKKNKAALEGLGQNVPEEFQALQVMLEEEMSRNIVEMLEKGLDVTKTLCNLIPILGKGALAIANGVELVNIIRKATIHYCKKHKDQLTLEASQEEGNMISGALENVRNAQAREAAMDTIDGILKSVEIVGNVMEVTPLMAIGKCVEALAGVGKAIKSVVSFIYDSSLAKKIKVLRRRSKQGDPEAQEEIFRYGFAESSGLIAIAIQENDPIAMQFVNSRLGSNAKWVGSAYNALAEKSGVTDSQLKKCSAAICRQWVLSVDDHEMFQQESPWENFKQMFRNIRGIESQWSNLQEFRWSFDAYNDQLTRNTNNIFTTSTLYKKNKDNPELANSYLEKVMPNLQQSHDFVEHLEVVLQSALIDMDELSADITTFNKQATTTDVLRLLNRRDLDPSSQEGTFVLATENALRSLTDCQQKINVQLRYLGTMHDKIQQQIEILNGFSNTDKSRATLTTIEGLESQIENIKTVELVELNTEKSEIEGRLAAEADETNKGVIQLELDAKLLEIEAKNDSLETLETSLETQNLLLINERDANQDRLDKQQQLLQVLSRANLATATTFRIFQNLPTPCRLV